MNWRLFDKLRRDIGPVELDLVENYAQNKISRRDFLKRGAIIGLSAPFMGAVIAACTTEGGTTTTAGGAVTTVGGGGTTLPPTTGGHLIVGLTAVPSSGGLDPVAMLDFSTYNIVNQSFEHLVGLGPDGNISQDTGLASSWSPNEDGSVWTFQLRQGVMWQDGTEFTSADVAATMDRMAVAENAQLAGIIAEGAVDTSDPYVAVFNLEAPNGNFPILVSIFNTQACITPADYTSGTLLDERPEGTGPFILESYDVTNSVARYRRNDTWWRGQVPLDTVELRAFPDSSTSVTAMVSREIDVLQSFQPIGGEVLLNDPNFVVLRPPSAAHRKLWFNNQQGQFTDARVRQAVAYAVDRQRIIDTIYVGGAELANDHPIVSSLPFYPEGAVEQRVRDPEKARGLLASAGVTDLSASIVTENREEMPDMAALIAQNLTEVGITAAVTPQDTSTFFGDSWCPGPSETDPTLPCDNSAEIGIVGWGHRPVPNVYLGSGFKTGAVWNAANFANSAYDAAVERYEQAVDVDGQRTALADVVRILHEETPSVFHTFQAWQAGHDASVSGVEATALGHTYLGKASKS